MSKRNRRHNTLSFAELRCKEVVNCIDGKRLGRIIDIVFGARDGRILGIVVPHARKNIIFRNSEPIFIAWDLVERIGEDILLVKIVPDDINFGSRQHRGRRSDFEINSLHAQESQDDSQTLEDAYQEQDDQEELQQVSAKPASTELRHQQRQVQTSSKNDRHQQQNQRGNREFRPGIDCDNKCSKCMLFDCDYRWEQVGSIKNDEY
jgi:YlmC/YmxH family sporulation protein